MSTGHEARKTFSCLNGAREVGNRGADFPPGRTSKENRGLSASVESGTWTAFFVAGFSRSPRGARGGSRHCWAGFGA